MIITIGFKISSRNKKFVFFTDLSIFNLYTFSSSSLRVEIMITPPLIPFRRNDFTIEIQYYPNDFQTSTNEPIGHEYNKVLSFNIRIKSVRLMIYTEHTNDCSVVGKGGKEKLIEI